MCEGVRVYVFLEKSRNADDNTWKEEENVTSLCVWISLNTLSIYDYILRLR